jgi:hypothetical protein
MMGAFIACFRRSSRHSFTVSQEIGGRGVPFRDQGIGGRKARIMWSQVHSSILAPGERIICKTGMDCFLEFQRREKCLGG